MKTLARVSQERINAGMTKPRRRVRRTESLPKRCALQHEDRTVENARARTRGPPQLACPMHEGNLVLKRGEKKFFREVTVAWAKAYGHVQGYM